MGARRSSSICRRVPARPARARASSPKALAVTIGSRNIVQVGDLSIVNALRFFEALDRRRSESDGAYGANGSGDERRQRGKGHNGKAHGRVNLKLLKALRSDDLSDIEPLTEREQLIGRQILKEIRARLGFLVDVGLDYLTLNRSATTLSGGEAQRIRLATQIGSSLMGVLYVLDEPSIGLHQRDNARLIRTLVRLRDLGNTLIVVEHDEDTMHAADHIIDMGPGAGEHGGYVVAEGTFAEITANPKSLTGQYLSGKRSIPRARAAARRQWPLAHDARRAREQSQEYRCDDSAGRALWW